jgi:hypothetical protein
MAAWPAMAVRLAEEQRREAMIAAWADGKVVASRPIGTNGFQIVAMATQRVPRHGPGQPLLMMGTPVLRPGPATTAARPGAAIAARPGTSNATRPGMTPRRVLLEVAEAPLPLPTAGRR